MAVRPFLVPAVGSLCPEWRPRPALAIRRGQVMEGGGFPEPYADYAHATMAALMEAANGPVTTGQDVADAVFRAATDPGCPAVLPAGEDAVAWAAEA